MSLFGSLYVGASGLQTGQNALNTTAHNLSNVDTKGYTRQQTLLTDKIITFVGQSESSSEPADGAGRYLCGCQTGQGQLPRPEIQKGIGQKCLYEVSYNTLGEVETLLGELDGESFSESMNDLWEAVQELAKQPASSVTQGLLIQRASQFVEQAGNVYSALSKYQDNLNNQIKERLIRSTNMQTVCLH